jgi:hypothetical protein
VTAEEETVRSTVIVVLFVTAGLAGETPVPEIATVAPPKKPVPVIVKCFVPAPNPIDTGEIPDTVGGGVTVKHVLQ